MKYCVVRVNLTQRSYEIACTGLYMTEARWIADSRNCSRVEAARKKPEYKLIHHHENDKIVYVPSRNTRVSIEYTLASLFPEYFHT